MRRALLLAIVTLGAAAAALRALAPPPPAGPGPGRASPGGAPPPHVVVTIPDWLPGGGLTLGRHVLLKARQQVPWSLGHELVHVRQQAEHGAWFWVSYLALPAWRLRWEAEAWAVNARAGSPIDGDRGIAAYLSGPAYLWVASREEAAAAVRAWR